MPYQTGVTALIVLCALAGACGGGGGGPGGGSEQVGVGAAAIQVGGPGGSSTRMVEPSAPDLLPNIAPTCPGVVRNWDQRLHQRDFEDLVEQTAGPSAGASRTQTLALLYNSLGRLYSRDPPATVLADLDRVAAARPSLGLCGARPPALLGEGQMFANAAIGNLEEARTSLALVEQLAPAAASHLQAELGELEEVVESSATPAPSPSEQASPAPTAPPSEAEAS